MRVLPNFGGGSASGRSARFAGGPDPCVGSEVLQARISRDDEKNFCKRRRPYGGLLQSRGHDHRLPHRQRPSYKRNGDVTRTSDRKAADPNIREMTGRLCVL